MIDSLLREGNAFSKKYCLASLPPGGEDGARGSSVLLLCTGSTTGTLQVGVILTYFCSILDDSEEVEMRLNHQT